MNTLIPPLQSHIASESWDQFFARIALRRKENIMACGDAERRAQLLSADMAFDAVYNAAKSAERGHREFSCFTGEQGRP